MGNGQKVLPRVHHFDVAKRAFHCLHLAGDSFVAFAANPGGPANILAAARSHRPFSVDAGEIVTEDVRRAASVGSMHNEDITGWKHHFWVECLELRVVPARNVAEKDVCDRVAREPERDFDSGQVVRKGHRA